MLELAAFVNAQKERPELKILLLFYKLSVEEFKQPKRQQSYVRQWMKLLGSSMSERDLEQWKDALKVISRINGLEYDRRMGEVAFRKKVVEIVCKRVKPDLVWDDSHVQGKLRLHKMIYEKIQSSTNSCTSTLFMGLYGVGGSGKTTMCKVIGNQMTEQYLGQVCLIELGSMDILQLLKKLLQFICSLKSSLVMRIDEGQALNLVKHHVQEKKICLMIDNVLDDQASIEEARTFLDLPFSKGSVILVTSRSRMTFETLNVEWGVLMKIPSLTMDEAKALFMHHTRCDSSDLLDEQKEVMEKFIDRCNFKVEDRVSREYHPLALKVLGTRAGPNPEEWVNVDIDFKCYENGSKHDIFSILRLGYNTLIPQHKMMFLDIALRRGNYYEGTNINDMRWQMRFLYDKKDKQFISNLVKVFQAKALVECAADGRFERVHIHDLYHEFAIMEVEKNEVKHGPCCCFSQASNRDHFVQERRLCIHNHPTSHITKDMLSCTVCSGVELFSIEGCPNLESVNVPHMQNLKIFEVFGGCPKLRSVNLEGAKILQCLSWVYSKGEYPELTCLESLEGLWLVSDKDEPPSPLHGCLDLSRNSKLEVLYLTYLPLNTLNFNQVVLLKWLCLVDCQHVERFEGVEALVQLEVLRLEACSSLLEFPSLVHFPLLEMFCLEGAAKLKEVHGFANLTALQVVSLHGGGELKELPGIEACTKLSELDLAHTNISDCSWLLAMKDLTYINLSSTKIRVVPDCSGLCKLSELRLDECQVLESIGNNKASSHPRFPKSLQKFSAWKCRSLNAIPQFHYESALDYLNLGGTSLDDISSVMYCQQLQELVCAETRITGLPSLSGLTRLKVLDVHGCEVLTEMDNIKSLPSLEELYVFGCTSLMALPDLGSATGLKALSLGGCPLVNPNLVKMPSGAIVDMEMEDAVADEIDHDVQECDSQAIVAVTSIQGPELSHKLWRCAGLLNLVAMGGLLGWWLGRRQGKRRLTSEHEVER